MDSADGSFRWALKVDPAGKLYWRTLQMDPVGGTLQVGSVGGPQAESPDSPAAFKAPPFPLPSLQHKSVGTS